MRHRLAAAYLVLSLALVAGTTVLVSLQAASGRGGLYDSWAFTLGFGSWAAALGGLLLWRRPAERLGWVVAALGAALLYQTAVDAYAAYSLHVHQLPAAAWVFVTEEIPGSVLIAILTLMLLLFPTGSLPSRRWRAVLFALLVLTVAGLPGRLLADGPFENLPQLVNPIGVRSAALTDVSNAANVLTAPLLLVAAASVGLRWRRADTLTRRQIKGLIAAAALWPAVLVVLFTTPSSFSNSRWGELVFAIPIGAMLLAVAVAVLRHGLYDIDRFISRTLSYTVVTALLAGGYVGGVALCTRILPFSSAVGVAASTLAVAAAFNPLRRRVQTVVDHRFNRARYDATHTVSMYSSRLRDTVRYETVVSELATTVARVVEPATVSVWVRTGADATPVSAATRGGAGGRPR